MSNDAEPTVGLTGGVHAEHVPVLDVTTLPTDVTPAGTGELTVIVYITVEDEPAATVTDCEHAVADAEPAAHDQPSPEPV